MKRLILIGAAICVATAQAFCQTPERVLLPPQEIYFLAKDGKVVLSWLPADGDNADGYNVFFKPADKKNWWKANDEIIQSLGFTVEYLKNATLYDFVVTSVDTKNVLESGYSTIVSTTPFTVAKAAPARKDVASHKSGRRIVKAKPAKKSTALKTMPARNTAIREAVSKPAPLRAPAPVANPANVQALPATSGSPAPTGSLAPAGAPAKSVAPDASGGDDWGDSKSSSW
jgi:hypothetical protein